eukprot:2090863-Rhodomonas_salina.1
MSSFERETEKEIKATKGQSEGVHGRGEAKRDGQEFDENNRHFRPEPCPASQEPGIPRPAALSHSPALPLLAIAEKKLPFFHFSQALSSTRERHLSLDMPYPFLPRSPRFVVRALTGLLYTPPLPVSLSVFPQIPGKSVRRVRHGPPGVCRHCHTAKGALS